MGNSSSTGQGHWTESSNVLRDAERIRTRPMPRPQPTPAPTPMTLTPPSLDATPTHVSGTTGSAEMPLGGGFSLRGDGPNASLGGRQTQSGGARLDAQANVGGVSVFHRNQNHEIGLGGSLGMGGGVELHGGDMPGVSFSAGPVTGTYRSTALGQPVSDDAVQNMLLSS